MQIATADAQEASGQRSKGVFGQFWRGILEGFEEFATLPGSSLENPGGRAPYKVPAVNGVVLFPWRYGDGRRGTPSESRFVTSEARAAMFRMKPSPLQGELDLGLLGHDWDAALVELLESARVETVGGDGAAYRVVVVAIACSVTGLHDVIWGEVVLADDGRIDFVNPESLLYEVRKPSPVAEPERRFDSGEPPSRRLRLQGENDELSGTTDDDA
ncbi:hypothetical protein QUV83_03270 [Cellulomonas cellasea]|uniref:hypothetical protein n=1 Tax=Cellulomonas cellasea TaxID=43670 RepID=UPI0025A3C7BC|nr:hypothetical protein [Cellulomonas cellasea]MDM8083785.1 hypothetical protein [Cellulomonas cellasea]